MFSMISHVMRHRTLRAYGLGMLVTSCAGAATLPYLSIAGIEVLGMSNQAFALMMFLSTISKVVFGVSVGIVSDFVKDTRRLIISFSLIGVLGFGLIWSVPTISAMWLASILIIPMANVNSLIYAGTRNATKGLPAGQAASINAVVRTSMSAAWVITPFVVALTLHFAGLGIINAWGISALLCGIGALTFLIFLPRQTQTISPAGGAKGFVGALKELGRPTIVIRVCALALLNAPVMLNITLQPLVIKSSLGGTIADAGLMASGVALLEIPFMLMWAALLPKLGTRNVLSLSAFLYALYLLLLGLAPNTAYVFLLIPLVGLAAAALLSVPISYVQDMFPERAGLGTALYPITGFAANGIAAGIFAAGGHFLNYQQISIAAALLTLAAIVFFMSVEAADRRPASTGGA